MAQKAFEQPKFPWGERQSLPGVARLQAGRIEAQIAHFEHAGAGRTVAPEQGPYPRPQFVETKRLHQVVVRATVQAPHPIAGAVEGREEQIRHLQAPVPQFPAEGEPIEARQHDIEQHQVVADTGGVVQPGRPVYCQIDDVALVEQILLDRQRDPLVVLDQQNSHNYRPLRMVPVKDHSTEAGLRDGKGSEALRCPGSLTLPGSVSSF